MARFLSAGVDPRPNALCPFCESLERHRLVWLYLRQRTNLFDLRGKLLHVAPERCLRRRFARLPNLQYVTGDIHGEGVDCRIDLTRLPFLDASFDAVVCNHVLEHVLDDRAAIAEIFRVLRPGGWAILMVPIHQSYAVTFEDPTVVSPDERARVFGQHDHVRICGRDYLDRYRSAGFELRDVDFAQSLDRERFGVVAEPFCFAWKPD